MSGKNCKKYEDLGIRYNEQLRDHYATPKQLRMIEAMWMTSPQVKKKDQEALRKFIKRILGKDHITWILKSEVQKVVKAIKSLKTKNKKKMTLEEKLRDIYESINQFEKQNKNEKLSIVYYKMKLNLYIVIKKIVEKKEIGMELERYVELLDKKKYKEFGEKIADKSIKYYWAQFVNYRDIFCKLWKMV